MARLPDGPGRPLAPKVPARVWTTVRPDGIVVMACGKHAGRRLDDVPMAFLRWVLDQAEMRPGRDEELELREAACEVVGGASVRSAVEEWTNVIVGHRSFSIPPVVAQLFVVEMARLQQLFPSDATAFEALVLNSYTTPLESLD